MTLQRQMAFFSTFSIVKILLFIALLIQPSIGIGSSQTLVNIICQDVGRGQQRDEDFCLDFFEQHTGGPEKHIEDLMQITIQQTLENTTNSIIFVSKLRKSSKPNISNLLSICESGYNLLKDVLVDASFSLAQRNFENVQFDAEKCPRFVQDCRKNVDGTVAQMRTINIQMDLLVRISLATSKRLGTQKTLY